MITLRTKIPLELAKSIRADAPQQLVGLAVRTDEWPKLQRAADRYHTIMSPYMMVRRYEWRNAGPGMAEVVFELRSVDCHRYFPYAREILTPQCETIRMAARDHAATLLDRDMIPRRDMTN